MSDYRDRDKNGFRKVIRIAGFVVLGILGAAVIAFLFGFFVMLLWNWLMPSIFGVREINFWEAFGFVLLIKLLFGGENGINVKNISQENRRKKHGDVCYKTKAEDMPWQEELKTWKPDGSAENWKYFDSYWKKEGRKAFDSYIRKIVEGQKNDDSI